MLVLMSSACFGQLRLGIGSQLVVDNIVLGLQGKVLYESDDNWRLGSTFTYHFDRVYDWTVDLDGQYQLITVGADTRIAPVLGFSLQQGNGGLDPGANAGLFIDFHLDNLNLYVEPKFVFKKASTIAFSAGLLF